MRRKEQLELFNLKGKKIFGGILLKNGNAREARPISTRKAMHLVLRSTLARGEKSFLKADKVKVIRQIVERQATKAGVKLYRYANSGNHLHLLILPRSRLSLASFLRAISGIIARFILKAQRGHKSQIKKFWDARPYSRIVEWGRDYKRVQRYLVRNILEALGFIPDMTQDELLNSSA